VNALLGAPAVEIAIPADALFLQARFRRELFSLRTSRLCPMHPRNKFRSGLNSRSLRGDSLDHETIIAVYRRNAGSFFLRFRSGRRS
jgi:hypothetical protein